MSRLFKYATFLCCIFFLILLPALIKLPVSILSAQTPQNSTSTNRITSIAFSSDTKSLVSVGNDTVIRLWDRPTGKQRQIFLGHENPISTVAVSPDGTTIASAGLDTVVGLWDAKSGKLRQFLGGHRDFVNKVAFSADGKLLASGSNDNQVIVWDVATGKKRQILKGHVNGVVGIAFSPDGKTLASGSWDATVRLWDVETGKQRQLLQGHTQPTRALAFSPDGTTLVSGGDDNLLIQWNSSTGKQQQILRGQPRPIKAVAFSPDGKTLISGSDDNAIIQWNLRTGRPRPGAQRQKQLTQAQPNSITALAFSPDGKTFASADRDGQIVLRDLATSQPRQSLQVPTKPSPSDRSRQSAAPRISAPNANATQRLLDQGPGGPILVITNPGNPFSKYYAEILRNEGFNAFRVTDINSVSEQTLNSADITLLGETPVDASKITLLNNWINQGGNLIVMRPDKNNQQLADLIGLIASGTTRSDQYVQVNTSIEPGKGIVGETIQFHGPADPYVLKNGVASLATLCTSADSESCAANPALTLRSVGPNGGQVAAFTYDLARSIVYTRQGDPKWATLEPQTARERDGCEPIRSDDAYYGGPKANCSDVSNPPNTLFASNEDWVNPDKIAIPQADEQQRLLANLILKMNLAKKPLPRFWYFPNRKKAVVILTGDDHAVGGTAARFNEHRTASPASCSVENWECIRSTSYVYPETSATSFNNQAAGDAVSDSFEVALHLTTVPDQPTTRQCSNYTLESITTSLTTQLQQFHNSYPSVPAPTTNRSHCLVWSDWVSQAKAELNNGIRLDTTYYYWPGPWVNKKQPGVDKQPGFFTGSGMVMRFADLDGTPIDVYQATTQMTDESGQNQESPFTIDTLLDKAIGAEGYYGAFVVNAHTDRDQIVSHSDLIVRSAKTREVPVISARQMLTWLDGRQDSSFSSLSWNGNSLSFRITPGSNTTGLQAMLPLQSTTGTLINSITRDGSNVDYTQETIKEIKYAFFPATAGAYVATYAQDTIAPTVSSTVPANGATNVTANTSVSVTFNESIDPATINASTFTLCDPANAVVAATLSYNAETRTAVLQPDAPLTASTAYTFQVKGGTTDPRIKDLAGNVLAANFNGSFTTAGGPNCPCSIWNNSTTPAEVEVNDPNEVELGVKFQSNVDGLITGIRFFKGANNTGVHVGTLWNSSGQELASVTFMNETTSGWQQASLSNPVPITSNTTFIVSYHTEVGLYSVTNDAFATAGVNNPPLRVLQNGESDGNGVYKYGGRALPTDTFRSSNYWVDMVFTPQ
jgi:WD40 repeat protein